MIFVVKNPFREEHVFRIPFPSKKLSSGSSKTDCSKSQLSSVAAHTQPSAVHVYVRELFSIAFMRKPQERPCLFSQTRTRGGLKRHCEHFPLQNVPSFIRWLHHAQSTAFNVKQ